jgi:hypothetical protein
VVADPGFENSIGLNKLAREFLRVSMTDQVPVERFRPEPDDPLLFAEVEMELQLPVNDGTGIGVDD